MTKPVKASDVFRGFGLDQAQLETVDFLVNYINQELNDPNNWAQLFAMRSALTPKAGVRVTIEELEKAAGFKLPEVILDAIKARFEDPEYGWSVEIALGAKPPIMIIRSKGLI